MKETIHVPNDDLPSLFLQECINSSGRDAVTIR